MTVDLITQGLTIVLVIYFGLHLRSQIRTLKSAVDTQKVTIEAQAESMKAQSAVLQDFERHSKIMQQVIDFFDPTAQLQREQAYKERFERDMKAWEEAISTAHGVMTRAIGQLETHLARRQQDTLWLKEANRELEEMSRQVHEDHQVLQEILEDRNHARTRTCRGARTSGAIPGNRGIFCAHMMRMTRNTYLRTAAFCLRTAHPT